MRTIPATIWSDLNKLLSNKSVFWLAAIEAAPGSAFYLADSIESVVHKSRTWRPWPLRVSVIEQNAEADLRQTTLTVSNIHRILMPYLEAGSWKGGACSLLLAWSGDLTIETGFQLDYEMQAVVAKGDAVSISLGHPNYLDRQFPGERYIRGEKFPAIPRV